MADVRSAGIRRAVHALGDARPEDMDSAVEAALELEGVADVPGLDAPLILAIAWSESRFDRGARPLCGVMQVGPRDMDVPDSYRRAACQSWQDSVRAGMEAGVNELMKILEEIPRVRGDLPRALEYRACGGRAFTGRCGRRKRHWVMNVREIAERIRRPPFHTEMP